MLSDETYDLCRPILEDKELEDEDKTDKLEELLRKETSLTGKTLENAVLDALWRHRNEAKGEIVEAPLRHTVIRKSSPAPWQLNRAPTPLGSPPASSPSVPTGFPSRPSFSRQRSTVPSPFASPRPSPRLALAQPIPHSPSLNAYEFSERGSTPDIYGDYGSDNVDWLVGDETASNTSSTGTGQLSAAAPEWTPQPDMSPYDILRSVLGDKKTDDEIEEALDKSSYDLGATIALLTVADPVDGVSPLAVPNNEGSVLVGKSMAVNQIRPTTPNTSRSPIVCKYWLASGSCLRADCRFAHDTSGYLCKYWMNGKCLAGDQCQFSHDPSLLVGALSVNEGTAAVGTPPPSFQMENQYDQFPSLHNNSPKSSSLTAPSNGHFREFTPLSQQRTRAGFQPFNSSSRPQSRPNSRHQHRPEYQSNLSMDDPDAFPTLSSLNAKSRTGKHHGARSRHGHNAAETPSSLADVVKMSPSPVPGQPRRPDTGRKVRTSGGSDSAAARRIPEPQHIPWLETGAKANQQYLKFRQEAIKHGSVRNKFLQSAAQAWNRNDARAAKALSLRGQAENDAMRKAHRDAARALYEERNPQLAQSESEEDELYIDLHGLHPEEAIEYLSDILGMQAKKSRKILYAITGTGHHSKNGKDKVGKGVRVWLGEMAFVYREFSVPGERGGYIGGVLGIDVASGRMKENGPPPERGDVVVGTGKIQIIKREDIATA